MKILLDTHALLWLFLGSERLSLRSKNTVASEENDVFVSAASAWEITTKHRLGKLPVPDTFIKNFSAILIEFGLIELPVSVTHGLLAGSFLSKHKDPFDRMIAAQAISDGMVLLSNDKLMDSFGPNRIW